MIKPNCPLLEPISIKVFVFEISLIKGVNSKVGTPLYKI